MAQRRSLAWTQLRVGVLVIVSFALLAFAVFVISGSSGFLIRRYTITGYFANANNLKTGAEVQLEGVTIGNVWTVNVSNLPDPAKAVEVDMRLDRTYMNVVRSDSKASIGTIGLLGEAAVNLTRGTDAGQVVEDGESLIGSEEGDIRRIVQGTNDFVANLQVLSDKVRDMADRVDRGEGTLGKFLTDSSIYENANLTVQEANLLVRDARTGNGTIGRLISDDELYKRVNAISDRVETLVMKIESGNGSAAKFINDPAVYNKADQLLARFQTIADRIERGEGSLGKFAKDETFYNETRAALNKVSTLVTSIENGEGTLGKFVKDPTLYNSANQTASEVLKLLYDFRQNPKKFLTVTFKLF